MNKKNTQQLSAPSMTVLLAASLAFAATTQAAVQTEGFYRSVAPWGLQPPQANGDAT